MVAALALVPAAHAGSRWGPKQTIFASRPGGVESIVTLDAAGRALAVGYGGRVYLATSRARGHFVTRQSFADEYAFPVIGITGIGDGRFIGLFFESGPADSGLYAQTREPNGTFGPREAIDPRPNRLLGAWIMQRSPTGDVFLIWSSSSSFCGCNAQLRASVRRAGEDHFGPAQVLSPQGRAAYQPRLAFDRDGNALLTWAQFRDVSRAEVAYTTRQVDADSFEPTRKVTAGGRHAEVGYLDLAANRAGRAVAVWGARAEPSRDVWAAFGTVAGGLDSAQAVHRGRARAPRVAVDRSGEAVATWHDPRPTMAVAAPGERFGRPETLEDARSTAPTLRADGAGTFTAAWRLLPGGAVHVVRRTVGSGTSRVTELAPRHAWRLSMAVTSAHDTLVAWSLRGARVSDGIKDALLARGRPGRDLGRPLDLRTGHWGGPSFPNDALDMAVDESGGAFVWWHHLDAHGDAGSYGRFLFPPGHGGSG